MPISRPPVSVARTLRRRGLQAVRTAKTGPSFGMKQRMLIYYTGRVQGVGFRYTVNTLVAGFDVTGTVRNVADGRVELKAEGQREELEAFAEAVETSELAGFIRRRDVVWGEPTGEFHGFAIVG
jgi:acylphosphatase